MLPANTEKNNSDENMFEAMCTFEIQRFNYNDINILYIIDQFTCFYH